jgi:hypothetical protein
VALDVKPVHLSGFVRRYVVPTAGPQSLERRLSGHGSRGASKWLRRSSPVVRAAHRALRRPPSDDDPISTNTTAPVVSTRLGRDTARPGAHESCRNVLPEGLFIGHPRVPQECVDEACFQIFVRHSIPFRSVLAGRSRSLARRSAVRRSSGASFVATSGRLRNRCDRVRRPRPTRGTRRDPHRCRRHQPHGRAGAGDVREHRSANRATRSVVAVVYLISTDLGNDVA